METKELFRLTLMEIASLDEDNTFDAPRMALEALQDDEEDDFDWDILFEPDLAFMEVIVMKPPKKEKKGPAKILPFPVKGE